MYLASIVVAFARRYPGLTFDFDLTPRRVNLVSEPVDVAIRMGELPDSPMIARLLARLSAQLYASPRYLEMAGEPDYPGAMAGHQCLAFPRGRKWTLHSEGGDAVEVEVGGRFQVNSVGMFKRLAALDMGIVMLPREVVAEDLAADLLRRVLPGWRGASTPVYALTETRLLPAKTQRFIEFLQEHLREAP